MYIVHIKDYRGKIESTMISLIIYFTTIVIMMMKYYNDMINGNPDNCQQRQQP